MGNMEYVRRKILSIIDSLQTDPPSQDAGATTSGTSGAMALDPYAEENWIGTMDPTAFENPNPDDASLPTYEDCVRGDGVRHESDAPKQEEQPQPQPSTANEHEQQPELTAQTQQNTNSNQQTTSQQNQLEVTSRETKTDQKHQKQKTAKQEKQKTAKQEKQKDQQNQTDLEHVPSGKEADEKQPLFRDALVEDLNISGIKQLCGRTSNCIRRCLWLLILIVVTFFMTITIGVRLRYYWSYPTIVDSESILSHSLKFPAVTVCNQNSARASGAYALDQASSLPYRRTPVIIYDAVTDYSDVLEHYSEEAVDEYLETYAHVWEGCDKCPNITFLRKTRHDKETLIHRCEWRGEECSPENFTEIISDLGICYQFNGKGGSSALSTPHVGIGSGLQLTLNMEQYEYMRNRQEVAGAYVVLQDQSDSAELIMGKTIFMGKGSFTNVYVTMEKYEHLPGPDNTRCTENSSRKSACLLVCLSKFIYDECGCIAMYMKVPGGSTNVSYCDIERHLQCTYPKRRDFLTSGSYNEYCGDCRDSCNRTKYSYNTKSGPMSDFYAASMSSDLATNDILVKSHGKASRLQDWAFLNQVDRAYTNAIFNMSLLAFYVHNSSTEEPVDSLLQLEALDRDIRRQLPAAELPFWDTVYPYAHQIHEVYAQSANYSIYSYLFEHALEDNRDGEETNVRLAHDFVNHLNETEGYISTMQGFNADMLTSISSLSSKWLLFTRQGLSVGEETIAGWNRTMGDCLTTLSGIYGRSAGTLGRLRAERAALGVTLALDRRTWYAPDYLHVGETEFFIKNFARVDIQFESMYYAQYNEKRSYDMAALICDLGGNLGLFLGGSLLTIVELVDIVVMHTLYVAFCCCFCDSPKRKHK